MGRKQIYTSEEKQKEIARITQELINCDDWLFKLMFDSNLQLIWIEKKQVLEYELQDLTSEELI